MPIQHDELTGEVEILRQFSLDLLSSIQLLRWVGFGLLALYIVNVIAIFLPLRFLDPVWELQAIGQLVETTPVVLIGFAMVLHGNQYIRSKRSLTVVKVLSWLALSLGIIMFLLIPLCFVDASRIQAQNQQQVQLALVQRLEQVQTVQDQIQSTTAVDQLSGLIQQFNNQYPNLKIDTSQSLPSLKQELNNLAQRARTNIKEQSQNTLNTQNKALLQGGFKWCAGLLISSVWLISLWRASHWARKRKAH